MKKYLMLYLSVAMLPLCAHAEQVVSNSKYPIVVEVYKGSAQCNPKENQLFSGIERAKQTYKGTKGGTAEQLKNAVKSALVTTMNGSGCDSIGQAIVLNSNESHNLPIGSWVIAYKDPVAAWEMDKKIVNPLPAICKVYAGKKIMLETRKSGLLKGIIGIGGDGGLKCTTK